MSSVDRPEFRRAVGATILVRSEAKPTFERTVGSIEIPDPSAVATTSIVDAGIATISAPILTAWTQARLRLEGDENDPRSAAEMAESRRSFISRDEAFKQAIDADLDAAMERVRDMGDIPSGR